MGYTLSDRGRNALDQLFSTIASVNGIADVSRQFALDPTSEQKLEDLQSEEVDFLGMINVMPMRDLSGDVLGLSTSKMIARRISRANLPRKPAYVGNLQGRKYALEDTLFDTMLPWEVVDAWSKFPDFATRYSRHVARSIGQTRISIGWNGTSVAADSNPLLNPNGEDMNIGWLHKLRLERPDHVMGRTLVGPAGSQTATGAIIPIEVGADEEYKNIDALAYDLISGMPSWARRSTELRVIVSSDLVDEKYFPMVNRPLSATIDGGKATSDEVVQSVVHSTRQIGGRPAIIVPFFPEGTMFVSPTKNLSLYWQEGSRRRYIRDEPENMAELVDYNSSNEGYVIEDTDYAVLAEGITFTGATG